MAPLREPTKGVALLVVVKYSRTQRADRDQPVRAGIFRFYEQTQHG